LANSVQPFDRNEVGLVDQLAVRVDINLLGVVQSCLLLVPCYTDVSVRIFAQADLVIENVMDG
jgi:hypothetical protein